CSPPAPPTCIHGSGPPWSGIRPPATQCSRLPGAVCWLPEECLCATASRDFATHHSSPAAPSCRYRWLPEGPHERCRAFAIVTDPLVAPAAPGGRVHRHHARGRRRVPQSRDVVFDREGLRRHAAPGDEGLLSFQAAFPAAARRYALEVSRHDPPPRSHRGAVWREA